MFSIDLAPFGLGDPIELHGELVESMVVPHMDLVFLFDEDHEYHAGIYHAVQNACQLIDRGVVDLIAVEGKTGNFRNQLDTQLQSEGIVSSLEQYIALMEQDPATELQVWREHPMFMYWLLFTRPDAPVWGVEDPGAYDQSAQRRKGLEANNCRDLKNMVCNSPEWYEILGEADPDKKAELFEAMKVRHTELLLAGLSADRPRHFLANLRRLRKELSCSRACILNAGTLDQDRVLALIRADRDFSVVRIRPDGMRPFVRPPCPPSG
jgi:hypothetical protein